MHRARSNADHEDRVAVPSRQTVLATIKKLRLTWSQSPHVTSQHSALLPSLCDAFDLTREDSDHDIRAQLDRGRASSLVGVDRNFVVHGDGGPRFEPWVSGTPKVV